MPKPYDKTPKGGYKPKTGTCTILGEKFAYTLTHAPNPSSFHIFCIEFKHKSTKVKENANGTETYTMAEILARSLAHALGCEGILEWG
jgi:hypothetical protein